LRRAVEPLEARQLLSGTDPVISEFLASNQAGLLDDFNTRQDWVEIYNPAATPLDPRRQGSSDLRCARGGTAE